ncbi:MAG: Clp protease N-terminal domain-containing protein, partial [Myxococcota bacterium]|nr:Clp protease N-terminal domain-containing protein [Myxococcota bacterium]
MDVSTELKVCLDLAILEARPRGHEFSTVEHLLVALLQDPEARSVLQILGADLGVLEAGLEAFLSSQEAVSPAGALEVHPSLGFSRVVQRAALHCQGSGKDEVGTVHVLVAIFREPDSHAAELLEQVGVTRLAIVRYLSHGGAPGGDGPAFEERGPGVGGAFGEEAGGVPADPLEAFTTNLSDRAAAGDIDPLIGRKAELDRIVHVLARRRKNNPLLVGDAGVGKTALVEGLAKRIFEGRVPDMLLGFTIYSLDVGSLLAGTR